jgi:hypothetical protein
MRHPVRNGAPIMAQLRAGADMTLGLGMGNRAKRAENGNRANQFFHDIPLV